MNKIEFDKKIYELQDLALNDLSKGIYFQEEYLDEKAFNYSLANIYTRLNTLYSSLNDLEDCVEFAKSYTDSELIKSVESLEILFKDIEVLSKAETSINSSYIVENIPFKKKANKQNILDRDGSFLKEGVILKNKLTPSHNDLNVFSLNPKDIDINSSYYPYSSDIKQFKESGDLLISTLFYNNSPTPIKQKITIKLPTHKNINYIQLDSSLNNIDAYLLLEGNLQPKKICLNKPFDLTNNATHLILDITQKAFIKENISIPNLDEKYLSYKEPIVNSKINSILQENSYNKMLYLLKLEEYKNNHKDLFESKDNALYDLKPNTDIILE